MAGHGGARLGAGRKKKITYTELSDVELDAPIPLIKGHSSFTKKQISILSESPHVVSITNKTISYTLVFKEAFWRRYIQGVMPAKIFKEFGYKWLNANDNRAENVRKDENDFDLILKAYQHRGYDKGARGIHMHLLHQKPPVIMNIKKIRRLMSDFHLFCPIRKQNPYRQMARQLQTSRVAPNLLARRFRAFGPSKVLLTDITYIPHGNTEV